MSGVKDLQNEQQFIDTSDKHLCVKNQERKYFLILCLFLFIICAVFSFVLVYYDLKFDAYVNKKINDELKLYHQKIININSTIQQIQLEVERLQEQLEESLKTTTKKPAKGAAQNLLQSSSEITFKGVAIADINQSYEFDELDPQDLNLIDMDGKDNENSSSEDLIQDNYKNVHKNFTKKIEQLLPNSNFQLDDEGSGEVENNSRKRRDAAISNLNGINVFETSSENDSKLNKNSVKQNKVVNLMESNPLTTNISNKLNCCSTATKQHEPSIISNIKPHLEKKRNIQNDFENDDILSDNNESVEAKKTVIAAHFGADSSQYSIRTHAHYKGNGRFRHPTGEYSDWQPSLWFQTYQMHKHFSLLNGTIQVNSPGLYFTYAQIFYSDYNDINGYQIFVNSKVVLQCITTTYTQTNGTLKSNTCYTGGVIQCDVGDKISIKTIDSHRQVILEPSRSFIGMFKLGESHTVKRRSKENP